MARPVTPRWPVADSEELNAHIARAERVLMNLNRLKAKALDENSPTH